MIAPFDYIYQNDSENKNPARIQNHTSQNCNYAPVEGFRPFDV